MAGPLLPDYPGSPEQRAKSSIRWGDPVAREVFGRSRTTLRTSIACSFDDDRPAETESKLEALVFLAMRLRSDVIECRAQRFELRLEGEDGFRNTPDLLVLFLDKDPLVIECKRSRDLSDAKLQSRLVRVARALNDHGMDFCVITEKEFPREICESNLLLLSRSFCSNAPARKPFPSRLRAERSLSFKEFSTQLGTELALSYIAFGEVSADLTKPITNNTIIKMEVRYDTPRIHGWYPLQHAWSDFQDQEYSG